MYAVTVTFQIKPGHLADFMPLMLDNAATSLWEEPHCRRFDVCTDPARENEVFLYELYDTRADFDAHLKAPHFLDFAAKTADFVAAKELRCFESVTE